MANIKSQIKRNRQTERARQRNRAGRSGLRHTIKRFLSAAESGEMDPQETYAEASRALDKAASKGLIHKNKAANQKSRLAKRLGSS